MNITEMDDREKGFVNTSTLIGVLNWVTLLPITELEFE